MGSILTLPQPKPCGPFGMVGRFPVFFFSPVSVNRSHKEPQCLTSVFYDAFLSDVAGFHST